MNIVVVSGRVTSVPRRVDLPSGDVRWTFDLASDAEDGASPCAVPVVCSEAARAAKAVAVLQIGDVVVVSGVVRRRFFRVGGATQSRTEVMASDVVHERRRQQARRVLERDADRLGRAASGAVFSTAQRAGEGRRVGRQREHES